MMVIFTNNFKILSDSIIILYKKIIFIINNYSTLTLKHYSYLYFRHKKIDLSFFQCLLSNIPAFTLTKFISTLLTKIPFLNFHDNWKYSWSSLGFLK